MKTQQAPPLEAAADDELLERSKTRSSHSFDESPESFAHTVTEKSFAKTKYNIIKESVDHKSKSNSETNKDLQQTGHSPTNNSLIKTSHNKDLDVAIVGGGITGLYAAYRIAKYASENEISRRVAVFEATGRLGGIVKTVTLGGFNAELGPMRFVLEEQPLFHGLLEELQIETKPFTGYSNSKKPYRGMDMCTIGTTHGASNTWPLYQLTRTGAVDTSSTAGHEDPFTLMLEIVYETFRPALIHSFPKELQQKLKDNGGCMEHVDISSCPISDIQAITHNFTEDHFRWIRESAFILDAEDQDSKIYLRDVSLSWLVHTNRKLQETTSFNYVDFLQNHAPFYHCYHHEGSAAEKFINSFRFSRGETLITIKNGVESIIRDLYMKLRAMGVEIHFNNRLAMMNPCSCSDSQDNPRTDLSFHGSADLIRAKTTFLCIPAWDIRQLGDTFSGDVPVMLSNVNPIKLFKIFFLVHHPWWQDDSVQKNQGLDRLPAREIHYYTIKGDEEGPAASCNNKKGVVLVYGDEPSFNTWSDVLENNERHHQMRRKLFYECLKHELDGDMSNVEDSIAVAWRGEAGDSSSVAFLGSKMSCNQTLREAQAVGLKGSMTKNIAIANGSLSDYVGFIEGGLRMAVSACLHHGLIV